MKQNHVYCHLYTSISINILSQIITHPKINELPIKVDFNSADSVAYHLACLIPLTSSQKQKI